MKLLSDTHLFWDSNIKNIDAEKNKEAILNAYSNVVHGKI
jgi:hypothetical protein